MKKLRKSIEESLDKVNKVPLIMTVLTLLFQGMHGYFVFEHISQFEGIGADVQALGLAFIIVGGVLFFSIYEPPKTVTENGKEKISWKSMCFYLMSVEIVINFYYHGLYIFGKEGGATVSDIPLGVVAIALDITIPFLIYRYATHIQKTEVAPYGYRPDGKARKYPMKKRKQ